ncbi:hypothetical protein HPB51_008386 [Rhipicephalus microplus]|uniref:Uncharacterized protein n=1 Tax=Rhipicephalus microplus TaxID=6941 RepID=A0A9J6DT95_RHIMP|nr:hypothetical protein HPB51_008386 [Rhipicephalus microplus]
MTVHGMIKPPEVFSVAMCLMALLVRELPAECRIHEATWQLACFHRCPCLHNSRGLSFQQPAWPARERRRHQWAFHCSDPQV